MNKAKKKGKTVSTENTIIVITEEIISPLSENSKELKFIKEQST
jgi:hypothetical protein